MLGLRIKFLREKQGISRKTLAIKAEIPFETLYRLERGEISGLEPRTLSRLADLLGVNKAIDFMHLILLNKDPRRFQAINVSRPKTGTTSIANIFSAFRSKHEFLIHKTKIMIAAHIKGQATSAQLRKFVLQRDIAGKLEMDSASFNHYYLDILLQDFPYAKYLFIIRDCFSWFHSVTNFVAKIRAPFRAPPNNKDFLYMQNENYNEYSTLDNLEFGFPRINKLTPKEMETKVSDYIDDVLSSWTDMNLRVLGRIPKGNSLVLRTNEISSSLDKIAQFIGVPKSSLDSTKAHSRKGCKTINVYKHTDRSFLESKFREHCGKLMDMYFPEYDLTAFINGEPPPSELPPIMDLGDVGT